MAQEILPGLYKIEVPLPRNPLKALNSYIIKGKARNLVVDTGFNREECLQVWLAEIKQLDIDLNKTDFFTTHMHADHCGLISRLRAKDSKLYCSRVDAAIINRGASWEQAVNFARISGFPEAELGVAFHKHPGHKYGPSEYLDFTLIKEGERLIYGDYQFQCIETPGHTPGHICLYEPLKKIFLAGDHLLRNITPNISLWSGDRDALAEYLASLDKILSLDIELVLPGHRRVFDDCQQRVQELKLHHERRLDEVLAILAGGVQSAYQVAVQMNWDLDIDNWDQFPVPQKWFATGEALAHLKYLEGKRMIKSFEGNKGILYGLS